MTCICCATIPTMEAALKAIKTERGDRGEIQIELYGDWTFEQAQLWLDAGISQAIYHQSRDALLAGETWGEKDLNKVKKTHRHGLPCVCNRWSRCRYSQTI